MRTFTIAVFASTATVLVLTMTANATHAAPPTPSFGPAIDGYTAYDGQDTCDPTSKPGVVDFKDLLQQTYGNHTWNIGRNCDIGGQSEHKEGRALDYGFDVTNATQRAKAEDLLNWLLAPDQYGNQHAMARRLGVMYIIWNYEMWRAYSGPSSWQPRSCDGTPGDCHTNHIHFSFGWAGALRQTTWWTAQQSRSVIGDFNGDGRTDKTLFRPSDQTWYTLFSGSGSRMVNYGLASDIYVPGDYNGDRRADVAVFRPSEGKWYVEGMTTQAYGQSGDIPVQADYDGDGKTDRAVFRPSNATWYLLYSGGGSRMTTFGLATDIVVPGDYNGDGRADVAVWRPSNGQWYVEGLANQTYGQSGDIPVQADYDGDGKTDRAVFRPSDTTWYLLYSGGGSRMANFGLATDIVVPGDYNGDGRANLAVYRPSEGKWYVEGMTTQTYGTSEDVPMPQPHAAMI